MGKKTLIGVVALVLFVWAPAASATTTTTSDAQGEAAAVDGSAGDDQITITVYPAVGAEDPDILRVEDPAGVTAGPVGCIQVDPNRADCNVRGIAYVRGGGGNDTITFSYSAGALFGIELLTIDGGEGNDQITGSEKHDGFITGGPGDDTIDGRGGVDNIDCGAGTDTVVPDPIDFAQTGCENGGGAGPAVLTSVTQANGIVRAAWTLPTGTETWDFEVATSPVTDSLGYFLDIVAFPDPFLQRGATSGTAVPALPPGTYYVHVISTPTWDVCEANVDDPVCVFQFSNILSVTVPAPPPPPPAQPAPPPPVAAADTVVALGAVTASSSQDVDKLSITLNAGEAVRVKLSGSVNVPGASKVFRFKTVNKSVGTGKSKLGLKLASKAKKAVKKALKRKKRLKAKLTLVVTDNAGNSQTKKYSVRLKP